MVDLFNNNNQFSYIHIGDFILPTTVIVLIARISFSAEFPLVQEFPLTVNV